MNSTNAAILEFLKEWLRWAKEPVRHPHFTRGAGLCLQAKWYGEVALLINLQSLINKDFEGNAYPFNTGKDDYRVEVVYAMCHLNHKRLAWVEKTIKELEDADS